MKEKITSTESASTVCYEAIQRHSLAASAVPQCSPTRTNSHKAQSQKGETSDRRVTAQRARKSRGEQHPHRDGIVDR
jgi:hypothetical protein